MISNFFWILLGILIFEELYIVFNFLFIYFDFFFVKVDLGFKMKQSSTTQRFVGDAYLNFNPVFSLLAI